MKMKNKIFTLFFTFSIGLSFAVQAADQSSPAPVSKETLQVCSNLDMYGDFAVDQRDSAMPKEVAFDMVKGSMNRNLKLPADALAAFIAVVDKIYDIVYADKTIARGATQAAIVDACSQFKGQNADKRYIANYLEKHPRSAWEPLKRVPLCENIAQSASNIVVARDRKMSIEKVNALVKSGLQNDQLTLRAMPKIITEVFENPDVGTVNIYAYNLKKCEAAEKNEKYAELAEFKPRLRACEKMEKKEEQQQCSLTIFGL